MFEIDSVFDAIGCTSMEPDVTRRCPPPEFLKKGSPGEKTSLQQWHKAQEADLSFLESMAHLRIFMQVKNRSFSKA